MSIVMLGKDVLISQIEEKIKFLEAFLELKKTVYNFYEKHRMYTHKYFYVTIEQKESLFSLVTQKLYDILDTTTGDIYGRYDMQLSQYFLGIPENNVNSKLVNYRNLVKELKNVN